MGLFSKILGDPNKKVLDKLNSTVTKINELEGFFASKSDAELKEFSQSLKNKVIEGISLEDVVSDSFALVRETSKRLIGLRHFDVQMLGGLVLHQGKISEMKTGEGKTLVATLPTYLNAIGQYSVHVITVNDYLAKRDAEWMGPIYKFLGLSVGCLQSGSSFIYEFEEEGKKGLMNETSREKAYQCDILYGTNNEFGFDYLRDNMAMDNNSQVQSKLAYAIVDEVDNILIDEARTPLIISGPAKDRSSEYRKYSSIARSLKLENDFIIDEKSKNVTLTEEGIQKVEKNLNVENLYDIENSELTHFIENALKAQFIFRKNQEYVVKDQQVILVDEFTGRLMQGRRLSDGLHQAIEAKENVKILAESITYATITLQNFFRMYEKLSGMTGTAITEAEEFHKIYNLEVVEVPTNSDLKRNDSSDLIFKDEKSKFSYIVNEVSKLQKQKSPVLIGTTSIEKSEIISSMLRKNSVPHNVLNAKFHDKEAVIIAEAGKPGAVTVATNMAGRGTDIVLGGSVKNSDEWINDNKEVISMGGLHVIGTERHESRRIDNQLRGRSGRQGDPGFTQFHISLEDDLMRRFGGERIKSMMDMVGMEDDIPIENKILTRAVENAQSKVEGYNFEIRKALVEYDDVMNRQREIIYDLRNRALKKEHYFDEWSEEIIQNILDFILLSRGDEDDVENRVRLDLSRIFFINPQEIDINFSEKNNIGQETENFIISSLENFKNNNESEEISSWISSLFLRAIDMHWVEHLTTMDNMRQGIGLQAAGQRDPLIQYKKTGFDLFENLLIKIKRDVSLNLIAFSKSTDIASSVKTKKMNNLIPENNKNGKIGRNDPCPCGSGLKYKKCFGTKACQL
ncbi:MAG: preprotein translocase subunit SecA [Chloroflexi bacterium]|nr:preprotein translocase subunit SecA [Chloroflexota bacterium]|tara:strand:+ start:1747 stop:4308 length:2562 start_codon:yes stop_codon:yes gene_type:complete